MATDNNIKNFTALDIEKYHRGLLSPTERHALEKAALDDPFLADALEGYAAGGVNVSADIADLKKRLQEKTEKAKVIPLNQGGKTSFRWWRAAAAVILIGGAGVLTYQFAFNNNKQDAIAQSPESLNKVQTELQDSISGTVTNNTNNDTGTYKITGELVNTKTPGLKTENSQPVTFNGSNLAAKDTVVASGDYNFYVTAPAPQKATDDKNLQGLVKESATTKPAAATAKEKERDSDVAANVKKDTDRDGVADKFDETSRNEESRARAAGVVRNKQENNYYRNNANVFRGRVTDANNNGIPFANVTNTQDNVGTYTDARGYFNLTSTDSTLQVQTRALGFNNYNIQLRSGQPENRVVMQEDQAVAARTLSDRKVNYERRSKDAHFKLEGEPEPEDGWEPYDSYLANNLNIPKEFKPTQSSAPGMVEVSFEVNKNGEPVNFKVEKSLCPKCDQEAIRLIKEGPKWKRKARKGRTTVAITF